jgi:ankyrin repeat protein
MLAATKSDPLLTQLFLDWGAQINAVADNEIGDNSLNLACYNGNWQGSLDTIDTLLRWGATARMHKKSGDTALHQCMHQVDDLGRRYAIIERLVKAGADINAQNNDGNTILLLAVNEFEILMVRYLLATYGSLLDLNIVNNVGKTAYAWAAELGFTEINDEFDKGVVIVGADGNTTARDPLGMTGLMLAAIRDDQKIGSLLIDRRADLNALSVDDIQQTALHLAISHQSMNMAAILIKSGARQLADARGKFPLHLLIRVVGVPSQEKLLGILVGDGKGDINVKDGEGNTLAHLAAIVNDFGLFQLLMHKYKATVNLKAQNKKLQTPADIIRLYHRDTIASLLPK